MSAGRDPYKYYRIEARELLDALSQGVLELEKAPANKDLVARLLRLAHTLKGASRVVRLGEIADGAHAMETILSPYRAGQALVAREHVEALLGHLDSLGAKVAEIDRAKNAGAERAAAASSEEPFETVRVELGDMDGLLEGLGEASIHLQGLRRREQEMQRLHELASGLLEQLDAQGSGGSVATTRRVADDLRTGAARLQRALRVDVDSLAGEIGRVRDAASDLRLLPASVVFGPLERAARDAAATMKKAIDFEASGGTTRLDAHVLGSLRDALLHVVRNAVVHGIEAESDRTRQGKPAAGRVQLVVERVGNRVAFRCIDDGRGIDVAALTQAAVRGGLLPADSPANLAPKEAFRLLLKGGLTTSRTVTDLSGRGIGLDVVREAAQRLKGEVSVHSETGKGSCFEIVVPVSLSSMPALVVESAGVRAAVPFDAVRTTMRLAGVRIARSPDGDSILFDGQVTPFVALGNVLSGSRERVGSREMGSVVVVQAGDDRAALAVDHIRGVAHAVVRPLPAHTEVAAVVAGASLDEDGNVQLVLDAGAVVRAARDVRPAPEMTAPRMAPVLVVDDSLTTRMLEQSILEAAGYDVVLATSAEEALEKAHGGRYGLFLVDVEMPGMDGFEFVARTRSDPALKEIPAILVTSRASPEDRLRGLQAGARAYITKGEFDQAFLLRTIRELSGQRP
ncbi:MAG TPA: response regulator [Polyangiaceae bacterium]|nr:response regulator [Polyangiaceae bacterium]